MESLLTIISLAVILSAGLAIVAHYLQPPRPWLIYIFKPLTTILILAVALLPQTYLISRYSGAIAVGLLFALVGDIALMLPGNHFLLGLASFLLTHLCYLLAFFTAVPIHGFLWPLLPLAFTGLILLGYLWPVLPANLKIPVGLYVTVIIAMVTLAVSRAIAFSNPSTLIAALGALLFLASDAMLAVDRFRKPFHLARAVVLSSYFVGQLMIALSIGL